ncbi:sugar phosphate isomerase/epimerase family protein [Nonomuraea sp. NPDC050547]|uniref:sugar phosphate isomerase/epimerase family protein n=1 Tax=unclassified Nonomuraea TaxID=2593643 RepID=UPI00378EF009
MQLSVCDSIFPQALGLNSLLDLLARSGFTGVELLGDPGSYPARHTLRSMITDRGLTVTALSAAARLRTGRDLSAADPKVRRATRDHLLRCVDFAADLGCGVVGVAVTAVGRHWHEESPAAEWGHAVEEIKAVAEHAKSAGTKLGIELLNRYTCALVRTVDDGLRLLSDVDSSAAGLVVDTFHAMMEESDVAMAVRSGGVHVVNVQVADSNRQAPGSGSLNLPALIGTLREIGYDGPLALEAFPPGLAPFTPVPDSALPTMAAYAQAYVPLMNRHLR